jgi:hypothetical protein
MVTRFRDVTKSGVSFWRTLVCVHVHRIVDNPRGQRNSSALVVEQSQTAEMVGLAAYVVVVLSPFCVQLVLVCNRKGDARREW